MASYHPKPSAPPAPESDQTRVGSPYQPNLPPPAHPSPPYAPVSSSFGSGSYAAHPAPPYAPVSSSFGSGSHPVHPSPPYGPVSSSFGSGSHPANPSPPYATVSSSLVSGYHPPAQGYGSGYGYGYHPNYHQPDVYSSFPPGTHPDVIRSFQMVDRNRNGYIEETELREALTLNYQKFSLGTLRLFIFLFRNPKESSARIGPKEFAEIWRCLGEWQAIFERFDRDRSGKIDAGELRDALYSLGYALPPSVLQVLMSRYDDGSGRRVELSFDSFVECGLIIKGLTEKFKEKDRGYTGSATLSYEEFMSMIIPFIVSD